MRSTATDFKVTLDRHLAEGRVIVIRLSPTGLHCGQAIGSPSFHGQHMKILILGHFTHVAAATEAWDSVIVENISVEAFEQLAGARVLSVGKR